MTTKRPSANGSGMRFRIHLDLNDPYQVRMSRLFEVLGKDPHARKVLACSMLQLAQDFYDRMDASDPPNAYPEEEPHHESQADL